MKVIHVQNVVGLVNVLKVVSFDKTILIDAQIVEPSCIAIVCITVKRRTKVEKIKEKVEETHSVGWTIQEAQELVQAIRLTCLNLGYFIGLSGDLLGGVPTKTLELLFTPGDPRKISEAVANGMKNAYVYVNEPNEEKLLTWLNKVWGKTKPIEASDPVVSFGAKQFANNGGEMPHYVGLDSNNSHVYINKIKKPIANKGPIVYKIGNDRTIEVKILPNTPIRRVA